MVVDVQALQRGMRRGNGDWTEIIQTQRKGEENSEDRVNYGVEIGYSLFSRYFLESGTDEGKKGRVHDQLRYFVAIFEK